MVRKITVMIVAIAGVLASAFPAYAQKGEKTLGIAYGFASYNTSGYVDVYFQYSFAEHVCVSLLKWATYSATTANRVSRRA